jgi:exopolyphosphatase/pppGpp-phosphohydrolase
MKKAAAGNCLLIDVGGGSCEISLSEHKRIKDTISLPLGAVRLTQEFLANDPPTRPGRCAHEAVHRPRAAPGRARNIAALVKR